MPRSPTKSPTKSRRRAAFGTATIVSFSLTLLAGSLAVLLGFVPLHRLSLGERVDVGALLFMMPVLALVLGVVFEAARIALRSPELPEPRRQQTIRWMPSRSDN